MLLDRYEWLIGLRYLRAKRSQHFISVITLLSMGGIALGVACLIVVLGVMTGFKEELQRQILGVTSHVVVQSFSGKLDEYTEVLKKVLDTPGVAAAAPYVFGQSMLNANGVSNGVAVRGVDPDLDQGVSSLAGNMIVGKMEELGEYRIILGKSLGAKLGVRVGDPVTVMAPAGHATAVGTLPRLKRFTVSGFFESGMYEYDNTLAYIHLSDAQVFFRMEDRVTGIEVRTHHPDQAFQVRQALMEALGGAYWVRDWMQMNRNFFKALQLEKATMFVILSLVVLVAAFNIISSLIMVVMEKGRDIAILKTMGAQARGVMAIFVINGGIIGVAGTLAGVGLGLTLAWNLEETVRAVERTFGIQIISGEAHFLDHLPVTVLTSDVVWITAMSLLISLLATLYPAWRAADIDPVEALRYE